MSILELLRACAEGNDDAAWEEFVARYQKPISLSIKRTVCQRGKDPMQYVDDLLQETYLKLCADKCRALIEFAEKHSDEQTLAYMKVIAINVTRDQFKSLHSEKRGASETDQLHEDFDPAARSESFGGAGAIDREVFFKEVHEQLKKCAAGAKEDRDCVIFWLYYLQGMTAKAIAAMPAIGLGAKGVETVIHKLTRCLREHLGADGAAGWVRS